METTKMFPTMKVGQKRAVTLCFRNLITGCADVIIKPEVVFKWQPKPENERKNKKRK